MRILLILLLSNLCALVTFSQNGCTDSSACNFDSLAVDDDGTCYFEPCNDELENAELIEVQAFSECDPVIGSILGATDSPESDSERNDVWYEFETNSAGCYGIVVSNPMANMDLIIELYDSNLDLLDSQDATFTGGHEIITQALNASETYFLNIAGWNSPLLGDFEVCLYDACTGFGCTDPFALNWNPLASADDDSCQYSVPGDYNGDGFVTVMDLLAFINEFGEAGLGLIGDLNGDGVVNTVDLLLMMQLIGG